MENSNYKYTILDSSGFDMTSDQDGNPQPFSHYQSAVDEMTIMTSDCNDLELPLRVQAIAV